MITRILIIEDEIIIARFIEQQLQASFPCTTALALSTAEARQAMSRLEPHLLLCDIHLGEEDSGIELIGQLRRQYHFEVIYISSYRSRPVVEKASATQPANYLVKPIDEAQLYAGVQLVIHKINGNPLSGKKPPPLTVSLNQTERRILQLIREQKTSREIAQALNLSPYTIKNQRHKICRKLDLKDENNALLRWALENNNLS